MRCSEFLESYSDYRDGFLTNAGLLQRCCKHLAVCDSCSRYDVAVRRGVMALSCGREITPSLRFRRALRARLAGGSGVDVDEPVSAARPGVAAALMLAATIALRFYHSTREEPIPTPQITEKSKPAPMVVANPGLPFITFTNLEIPAFPDPALRSSRPQVSFGTPVSLPR